MAASSSSSSSGAAGQVAVNLYDANRNIVAVVDLPVPLPALVLYLGNYYVWQHPTTGYQVATPFVAQQDLGAAKASVVADPPPMQL